MKRRSEFELHVLPVGDADLGIELRRTRTKPFRLPEQAGVRLGLALLATKPLRKIRRVEEISGAVRTMSETMPSTGSPSAPTPTTDSERSGPSATCGATDDG